AHQAVRNGERAPLRGHYGMVGRQAYDESNHHDSAIHARGNHRGTPLPLILLLVDPLNPITHALGALECVALSHDRTTAHLSYRRCHDVARRIAVSHSFFCKPASWYGKLAGTTSCTERFQSLAPVFHLVMAHAHCDYRCGWHDPVLENPVH